MPVTVHPKLVRQGLPLLPISLLITWLAISAYVRPFWLQFSIALVAACWLTQALLRQQAIKRRTVSREQFKWFLELLLSRLTTGTTLERAISDTIPGMGQMLSSKSPFLRALRTLNRHLQARQSLNQLLPALCRQLDCPEARYYFRILPELQRTGSQITPFSRHFLHMISEQLTLQQDVGSETTQRRTEAVCLASMPFVMALLTRSSFDPQTAIAMNQTFFAIATTINGLIALTALVLVSRLVVFDPDRIEKVKSWPVCLKRYRHWRRFLAAKLHSAYRTLLPASYSARFLQILYRLEQQPGTGITQKIDMTTAYFVRKLDCMLLASLPGILCVLVAPAGVFLFLLPFVVAFLHDRQMLYNQRQQQLSYQLLYPVLISVLTALLQAGLSLHRSFEIASTCVQATNHESRKDNTGFYTDMTTMLNRMHSGSSVHDALLDIMDTCPLPEAQAALLLLQRYGQAGENETLQLLTMQASACWVLHRNATRKKLEQQSMKLLLPMTLDLLAVLLTALLPAVFSLQTF